MFEQLCSGLGPMQQSSSINIEKKPHHDEKYPPNHALIWQRVISNALSVDSVYICGLGCVAFGFVDTRHHKPG